MITNYLANEYVLGYKFIISNDISKNEMVSFDVLVRLCKILLWNIKQTIFALKNHEGYAEIWKPGF